MDESSRMAMDLITDHAKYRDSVQEALLYQLRRIDIPSKTLFQAMEYALSNTGKCLRPMMVFITGETLGSDFKVCLAPALAVELIHTYSLIHDDLPAMDNDDIRRGRPSLHKAFDEATAILAGDGMQGMAFQCLVEAEFLTPSQRLDMIQILALASGPSGMVSGQALDLAAGKEPWVTQGMLENIHRRKTGALIQASIKLGALTVPCLDLATLGPLDLYAQALGIAFQIQDDILDDGDSLDADPSNPKVTYVSALGLEAASQARDQWHQLALQHLNELPFDTTPLIHLANFVIPKIRLCEERSDEAI